MNIDKDIIGKPPNVATIINEQLIKKAESYKQEDEQEQLIMDTREQLEADILNAGHDNSTEEIFDWLDRQAAITEREFWECYANVNQWEAHQYELRCEKLTAERNELEAKCNRLSKDVIDRLKRENEELKDRNYELETAFDHMNDLLIEKQRVIDIQRESFKQLEYELTILKKKGVM